METSPSTKVRPQTTWRDLYVSALLEHDPTQVPRRIAQAEREIVNRARELFHAKGNHLEEEQALDCALYRLRALKSCLLIDSVPGMAA